MSQFYTDGEGLIEKLKLEKWHLKSRSKSFLTKQNVTDIINNIILRGTTHQGYYRVKRTMEGGVETIDKEKLVDYVLNDEKNEDIMGMSAVLAMRFLKQQSMKAQPVFSKEEDIFFQYNGELYSLDHNYKEHLNEFQKKYGEELGNELRKQIEAFDFKDSDTKQLFELIQKMSQIKELSNKQVHEGVKYILACFEGEFAFCFYSAKRKQLFVAKDFFGRRSLLLTCLEGKIMIHSIGTSKKTETSNESQDIPEEYKHRLEYFEAFKSKFSLDIPSNTLFSFDLEENTLDHLEISAKIKFNKELNNKPKFADLEKEVDRILNKSVKDMIGDRNIVKEPVGVFFSGGIDSTLIAYYVLKNVIDEVE